MTIEELIDRYGDDILRLCIVYLGDRALAEDACQETFIRAWRHMDSFRGESNEKTWLSSIAVNVCRDMLRSGWMRMLRRSQPVETLLNLASGDIPRPPSPVRDAVLQLPGRYREVILLYYDQNMNTREIAECLHCSQNSVSTRLRRARNLLQKALGEEVLP
ncbi:MAG: sigma-70 family RNA polymerase sigma factor [bacterium]|nr:sigma-70 family RNA polymerase sigma factor [bacterium]